MFEPDLDELEERVSEIGEMLRDLGAWRRSAGRLILTQWTR